MSHSLLSLCIIFSLLLSSLPPQLTLARARSLSPSLYVCERKPKDAQGSDVRLAGAPVAATTAAVTAPAVAVVAPPTTTVEPSRVCRL